MRVLERRAPISIELPARSNRPYVVAASVATAANVVRPEVAMQVSTQSAPSARPATRTVLPRRRTHRLRALIFLTLLVATPSVWVAHVFGTLLLWPTVAVTVAFVLDLMLVRSAVGHERAARRRAARLSGRPDAARRVPRPASEAKPFPATAGPRATRLAAPSRGAVAPAARTSSPAAAAATARTVTAEAAPVHSQEAVTEIILREGEWAPVAVPRPTYTMKAKADRPSADGGPLVAESDSAPTRQPVQPMEPVQPAIAIDEFDLDSVLDRRRAAGE
jgi:hypothetical protein